MEYAFKYELPKPHIKMVIQCEKDTHTGYCSDHEEILTLTTKETYYLPTHSSWNFSEISWEKESYNHCSRCQAMERYTIISIQLVT